MDFLKGRWVFVCKVFMYISPPSLVHLTCFVLNMLFSLLLLLGLVVECISKDLLDRFALIVDVDYLCECEKFQEVLGTIFDQEFVFKGADSQPYIYDNGTMKHFSCTNNTLDEISNTYKLFHTLGSIR